MSRKISFFCSMSKRLPFYDGVAEAHLPGGAGLCARLEALEQKLGRIEYVKEVAVYEEDKDITAEFYLDEEQYPDAKERLEADVKTFNCKMPASKNVKKIKIRDIPFEKTTTMKIKRYLLSKTAANK